MLPRPLEEEILMTSMHPNRFQMNNRTNSNPAGTQELNDSTFQRLWHRFLDSVNSKKPEIVSDIKHDSLIDSALEISKKTSRSVSPSRSLEFLTQYEDTPLEFLTQYEDTPLHFLTSSNEELDALQFITEYKKPSDEFITTYDDKSVNLEFITVYHPNSFNNSQ